MLPILSYCESNVTFLIFPLIRDTFGSPPLSFYSRKPTVVLPEIPRRDSSNAEKGTIHEDNLDRHVEDILSKRDQWRRIMKGVWAFMKTREKLLLPM